ncbi:MAG: MOSC domain-containing protein, partial [Rhodocyclales bacterium]|nr:MOSC domain-containing protein [Rhodocyclales bacterium]
MTQVQLAALYRYPVKSMGGARVQASPVSLLGLAHDRMWMVADASGQMITGRTCPEIVLIQATPAET